jgi:hypothetical protein
MRTAYMAPRSLQSTMKCEAHAACKERPNLNCHIDGTRLFRQARGRRSSLLMTLDLKVGPGRVFVGYEKHRAYPKLC